MQMSKKERVRALKETPAERALRIQNEKAHGLHYSRIVPTKREKARKDCRKPIRLHKEVDG